MTRSIRLLCAIIGSACISAGCSGDSTRPPQPGALVVTLSTPASDDGAVMLTVRGPGVSSAQAASPAHRVFTRMTGTDELRAIVIGPLTSGPVLTVQVGDVNSIGSYSATVNEVAAANDELRTSTAGYNATLGRSGS